MIKQYCQQNLNVLKEYDDMKKNKKIKDLNSFKDFRLSIKQYSIIV